ncbi:magnesium transporter [Rhodobacteraceae bacterium NNCM2]|nr:magnesium transporter [Coraliihabitans acroporae]
MSQDVKAAMRWRQDNAPEAAESNAAVVEEIQTLIKDRQKKEVLELVNAWPPVDIVSMLVAIRFKAARKLVSWLPDDLHLGVLSELDPRMNALLFEKKTQKRLAKLLRRLDHDRALRLLEAMPPDMAEDLVASMDDPEGWRRDLAYLEDTAGAIMRRRFIAVVADRTIGDLKEDLRARSEEFEKLDAIYVVDEERHLLGYLRVRDLLLLPSETLVSDVVRPDLVAVDSATDQEEVLRLAARRGLRMIAVRDEAGRLIGSVTPRELAEIARDEAEEDMLLMAGVSPDATAQDKPLEIVKRRLPWLLGGLVGASVAAVVIGSFEDALEEAAILASFIPVVMAMAGNAGIQASTVTVQGLAAGTIWPGDTWSRLGREIAGAAMNGLAVATVVSILIFAASMVIEVPRPFQLAASAGLALVIVTTLASSIGATVPVVIKYLGLDPAVATGIFITTSNDVFGVLTFFLIASQLYL